MNGELCITSITTHRRFGKPNFVKHILPALEVHLMENGYNSNSDKGKEVEIVLQELESKLRSIRAELTRVVREGNDEDGTQLRRLLAELERLENQRMAMREYHNRYESRGGAHASLAA
jgi:hypothetical protein